jgi:hypothetical protein
VEAVSTYEPYEKWLARQTASRGSCDDTRPYGKGKEHRGAREAIRFLYSQLKPCRWYAAWNVGSVEGELANAQCALLVREIAREKARLRAYAKRL